MPFPRVAHSVAVSSLLCAGIGSLSAQTFSTLVNITPCRVMDTRNANGPLGGPYIKGASTRNVPIPSSSCQIPSTAVAYSLNVTVVPRGTLYFITVWPAGRPQPNASTLNSFQGYVLANAAIVPAGANGAISVFASGDTDLIVDINGYYINLEMPVVPPPVTIPTFPTVVSQSTTDYLSTAIGAGASSGGAQNTAVGANALANGAGHNNTALGANALRANSNYDNTAVGALAMTNSAGGYQNSALGAHALENDSGTNNVAVGFFALQGGSGLNNTAIGSNALSTLNGGTSNIAIGSSAGWQLSGGDNNIYIGSFDDPNNTQPYNESGHIRIGDGTQNSVYISGIYNNILPSQNGLPVYVTSDGKLFVTPSSRRYKEDIHNIGTASDKLYQLRPVQFRYKKPANDGTKPIQFGLIAEEVANVYPELVIHNKDGQIEGVQYQQLPALLLNELQKQAKQIRDLTARLAALEEPVTKTTAASTVQQ